MLPDHILMLPAQIPGNLRWKHQNGAWKHRLPQAGGDSIEMVRKSIVCPKPVGSSS